MGFSRPLPRYLSASLLLRIISLLITFSLLAAPLQFSHAGSSSLSAADQAASLLEKMTPEEKVGQLFLIAFQGPKADQGTQIYDLIVNHHIGGVVLINANDNFATDNADTASTPRQALALIHQLQQNEWEASQTPQNNPVSGEAFTPVYIPLFIGLSQEGYGYPYDQILSGLTPLPNAMSIGATWDPSLATQVGTVLGQELSSLGFNLLLGPSLDVLENPEVGSQNNLGTRTFGGEPYWVAEMGKAYIRGVHQGSQGLIAVIAKHFPGHGASDRIPEEEVATIRKSFEELLSFDLAPFLAVTANAGSAAETADGFLVSHVRYQGLQGNIRTTTRPISFDPQALGQLLGLPELSAWRSAGGLAVSDNLGSRAIRHFYELTNQTFDARRVSLNAFLAGNDLLYVADFTSPGDADSYAGALRTLSFFAQKYREDPAFAQRVDESALRLLTLKFRLYPNFTLQDVLRPTGNLEQLGTSGKVTFEVARRAATLISPSSEELEVVLPDPPDATDRIVFITDVRSVVQCSTCVPTPIIKQTALQETVIRLYGPQSTGQVSPSNLASYSLQELQALLDGNPAEGNLARDLNAANWIVFAMLNSRPDIPSFHTLERFLNEQPGLLQQKRVMVFAFCAPYFLDATNISKLTAYYALYDQTPQFIDTAAYLLFRELRASGASPVSISGINYNLNEVLFPDPEQIIPLELDIPTSNGGNGTLTPTASPVPEFHVGDIVPVRTGVILDHNGHPVPDGTPVSFFFITGAEATAIRQIVNTRQGIARTTFAITTSGTLEIRAESENARSNSLKLDVPAPGSLPPTPTPTEPPTSTPAPTPSPTPESEQDETTLPPAPPHPGLSEWLAAVLLAGVLSLAAYQTGRLTGQFRWGLRAALLIFSGGLLVYCFLALPLPGNLRLLSASVMRAMLLGTLGGCLAGLLGTLIWYGIEARLQPRSATQDNTPLPSAEQRDDQAEEQQPGRTPEQ